MDLADYDWVGLAEKVVIALLILIATWIIARLVKWAIAKAVSSIGFLQRQGTEGRSVGESIGQIASLLVWLFGLVAILQVFELEQVLEPITALLEGVMAFLPNLIGAAFLFFIGYIIAKIVKQLIETTLSTVNFSGMVGRARAASGRVTGEATGEGGAGATTTEESTVDNRQIASVVANLVFAIILIVVAIAALQILGIRAISEPAEQMLTIILNAIPAIIAAALILGIGYLIARFTGDLLESTLRGLGTDRAVASLGIVPEGKSASTVLAKIAQVAIMLFFAIMAARALNFPEITNILNEVLELGGRVLFGAAIIAAGFVIANLLARAIGSGTAATIVKYATLVLFVAMGLQYMGIADTVINLAFGALVVGAALAAAIAYGLGGRDAAARSLQKAERKAEAETTSGAGAGSPPPSRSGAGNQPPTTPPTPPTP